MILILNATVIKMDEKRGIIKDGGIAIEGERILDVDRSGELIARYGKTDKVIDGSGMIAIPGLVNAHTHMFQSLLRGLGDDMDLSNWLKRMLYPVSQVLSEDDVYIGSLLSCIELIKTGTTFVIDNHHMNTSEKAIDYVAKAIEETGIKGLIARGMKIRTKRYEKSGLPEHLFPYSLDEEIRLTEKLIRKWNGKAKGRIKLSPGPVTIDATGPELLIEAKNLSDKYNVPLQVHVAETSDEVQTTREEYGKREVEFLYELGVLSPKFHVVHGVWLNDNEIKIMGKTRANLIHCPVSNMYLASGVAPIPELLKCGVNVALATDGPASNNNQDMIRVLKTTALLHKVSTLNPEVTPCEQVLEMATIGGARALGLENEIGSIECGKKADVVLVNFKRPHIIPVHRAISALVYCSTGNDVDTVIIDGNVVMENGNIKTLDEGILLNKAQETANDLIERATLKSMP